MTAEESATDGPDPAAAPVLTCNGCYHPIPDGQHCGTVEHPYCVECWLIRYYLFPRGRLRQVYSELAQYRAAGVEEDTLRQLLRSTLRQHARQMTAEQLANVGPMIDRMLAQVPGGPQNAV